MRHSYRPTLPRSFWIQPAKRPKLPPYVLVTEMYFKTPEIQSYWECHLPGLLSNVRRGS